MHAIAFFSAMTFLTWEGAGGGGGEGGGESKRTLVIVQGEAGRWWGGVREVEGWRTWCDFLMWCFWRHFRA